MSPARVAVGLASALVLLSSTGCAGPDSPPSTPNPVDVASFAADCPTTAIEAVFSDDYVMLKAPLDADGHPRALPQVSTMLPVELAIGYTELADPKPEGDQLTAALAKAGATWLADPAHQKSYGFEWGLYTGVVGNITPAISAEKAQDLFADHGCRVSLGEVQPSSVTIGD